MATKKAKPKQPAGKKPSAAKKQPAAGKKRPAAGKKQPAAGKKKPAAGKKQPAGKKRPAGRKKPAAGKKKPAAGKKKPAAGRKKPAARKPTPATRRAPRPADLVADDPGGVTKKLERGELTLPLPAADPVRDLAAKLVETIETGDADGVRDALLAGAIASRTDHEEGCTPLELAAGLGQVPIMRLLLEAGAAVDHGLVQSPLGAAASQGHAEAMEVLLAAGARVDAPGEDDRTALMSAAANGQLAALGRLLGAGADPDLRDAHGASALALAAASCEEEAFALLRERTGADEVARADALLASVQRRRSRRTRRPELPAPAHEGSLLSEELSARGATAVTLDHGTFSVTFPWGREDGDLLAAAEQGYLEILGALLRDGADPEEAELLSGHTALMRAASSGHLGAVELLLAAGADVHARDQSRHTALHHLVALPAASAGRRDRAEIAGLLLGGGAQPEAVNDLGETALHLAVRWGYVGVARALLDAGANATAASHAGETPRQLAAGHAELAPLLGG